MPEKNVVANLMGKHPMCQVSKGNNGILHINVSNLSANKSEWKREALA